MPLAKLQASRAPGDFPESRLSDLPWTAVRRRVALIKQTVRARSARISHRGNAQKSRTFKRVARDPHGVEQASIALRYWSVECDSLASASGFVKRREPRDAWVYGEPGAIERHSGPLGASADLRPSAGAVGTGVERCRRRHKDLMALVSSYGLPAGQGLIGEPLEPLEFESQRGNDSHRATDQIKSTG